VDIAAARKRGVTQAFTWRAWSPEAFADAHREGKLVLLDGAAEWCHWCHVMDATTYRDPEVGRILSERFIAIRVDVDEHPDLAERYGAWGWPATIVFSPQAEEIGKYRGYLPPDELRRVLSEATEAVKQRSAPAKADARGPADVAPPVAALPWIAGRALVDLDGWYDAKEGGWGMRQKAPFGANVEIELVRGAHRDAAAQGRAIFTLGKQRALIDPVWGGVYQYSAGSTWTEPHYEKLMTFQAANLEAYARAFASSRDPALLTDAQGIARYMGTFLSNAEGAFLVSQDADVGAHDDRATFVDGDVYYRLGDRERRALGIPRVDDHVYGHENGLAIAAFVTLFEATRDNAVLTRARLAADVVLRTLVAPDGVVRRSTREGAPRYLADAASFGRALARLAQVFAGSAEGARYRAAALAVATAMQRDLADETTGAFWDRTPDAAAAGVFARRDRPFSPNVLAARFFGALARVTGDDAWKERGRRALAAICTPHGVDERGRQLGELLLALDDVGVITWPATPK
jgi:uncharacterized protein YyaL (SSP411 family)